MTRTQDMHSPDDTTAREEMLRKSRKNNIAVFPRSCIQGYDGFVRWSETGPIVRSIERTFTWMPREEAEKSKDWLQPIPCALLCKDDRYFILRRVRCNNRKDLSSRITLLVGGHVDQYPGHDSLLSILRATLTRELDEELGIADPPVARVGLVIDSSSAISSMHIAFVYEVMVEKDNINTLAAEEFLLRSRLTGKFFTPSQLGRFHTHFDPWSLIVFEEYLASSTFPKKTQRQIGLPWFI